MCVRRRLSRSLGVRASQKLPTASRALLLLLLHLHLDSGEHDQRSNKALVALRLLQRTAQRQNALEKQTSPTRTSRLRALVVNRSSLQSSQHWTGILGDDYAHRRREMGLRGLCEGPSG